MHVAQSEMDPKTIVAAQTGPRDYEVWILVAMESEENPAELVGIWFILTPFHILTYDRDDARHLFDSEKAVKAVRQSVPDNVWKKMLYAWSQNPYVNKKPLQAI